MNNDIAEAFWIIYGDFLTWVAAATTVGGMLIGLFIMLVSPVRRRT